MLNMYILRYVEYNIYVYNTSAVSPQRVISSPSKEQHDQYAAYNHTSESYKWNVKNVHIVHWSIELKKEVFWHSSLNANVNGHPFINYRSAGNEAQENMLDNNSTYVNLLPPAI